MSVSINVSLNDEPFLGFIAASHKTTKVLQNVTVHNRRLLSWFSVSIFLSIETLVSSVSTNVLLNTVDPLHVATLNFPETRNIM